VEAAATGAEPDSKPMKYASPRGQTSRIDVHPRNRDKIADATTELWITEGIKKADSLTSRGLCVIALTGVFNWRSTLGTSATGKTSRSKAAR
jgi:Domain of unknown function (DUF3854)